MLALQRAAYQIEAEIINYYRIPPLIESLQQLMASTENYFAFIENKKIAGVLAYRKRDDAIHICKLAVHPDCFRRSIGTQLLRHLFQIGNAKKYTVSTGMDNAPAIALYKKEGFEKTGERLIDGVQLIIMGKEINTFLPQ